MSAPETSASAKGNDRNSLLVSACIYYSFGLFPVPGIHIRGKEKDDKKPALTRWSHYGEMARRGVRPPLSEIVRLFREAENVNAIGHILMQKHWVLDVDGAEGRQALSKLDPLPAGPRVDGMRGFHHYGLTNADLPAHAKVGDGGGLELLGPGWYVELPPSPGKRWLTPLDFPLPELPTALLPERRRGRAKAGTAKLQATRFATPEEQLAPWRELLPNLRGNGPWRDNCPLHEDGRESFSVFPGRQDGQLLWKCQAGCEGSGASHAGTFIQLQRLLSGEYERALALAEDGGYAPEVRSALTWVIRRARTYKLDLRSDEGIGASLRQLAKATGCEEIVGEIEGVSAGRLKHGGRGVYALLEKLKAAGVGVCIGSQNTPAGKGKPTRLYLRGWLDSQALPKRPHIRRVKSPSVQGVQGDPVSSNVRSASSNVQVPPSVSGRKGGSGGAAPSDDPLLSTARQVFPGAEMVK